MIKLPGKKLDWALELKVPQERIGQLPFKNFGKSSIQSEFRGFNYTITCKKGSIVKGNNTDYVLRFVPSGNDWLQLCELFFNKSLAPGFTDRDQAFLFG